MTIRNKAMQRAADGKLAAGVQQFLVPGNVTLTVAGVSMAPAQVEAAIQSRVTALDATTAAQATAVKAVSDAKATLATTQPVVNAVKQIALIMYANQPDVLAVFGVSPKKAPTPATLAQKNERAAKVAATRLARHTMGPKAKAKVKGTVTPATPVSEVQAPVAQASASSAPATPAAPSNGATGTGHP